MTSAPIGTGSKEQFDHELRALRGPELTAEDLATVDEYGVHGTGLRG